MCGRFTLLTDLSVIKDCFHIQEVTCDYKQGNNISPTQLVNAVVNVDYKRHLTCFRWGLIPSWTKDPSIGDKMFNARAETITTKPSFKDAFRKQRCLIIADGFYEWQKIDNKKVPIHFSLKSGAPFGFAGLYETWMLPDNEPVRTCTIITTKPNELIRPIHDRMPVIVPKDKETVWINARLNDQNKLISIMAPYPSDVMKMSEGFIPAP